MPKSDPTIYDVAKVAGVSIATVSRVLNTSTGVNPQTRAAVMAAIDQLNFVPKAESRARALTSTGRIGVLIPFFTAPSFVQRLRGIASVMSQKDYELVIYPIDTHPRMVSYLETLPIRRNLDGLIIVSQVFDPSQISRLLESHFETVMIESFDPNFSTLQIDDEAGGEMAASYLLEKGHKRFAFVGGSDLPTFGHDPIVKRLAGFRRRLTDAGIDLLDTAVHCFVTNPKETLENLIILGKPLAIFAATDLKAIALLKEARSMGLHVPQDLAIVGFDDIDMAAFMGLTTVRQPLDESGKIAAELLLSRLNDPNRSVQHIKLPLQIVVRETA
jgi:DNA-binding LacI/PurR family transcriptional regulator